VGGGKSGEVFSGAVFVEWIRKQKEFPEFKKKHDFTAKQYNDKSQEEKDVMFAVQIGQALLDHRLAHHVTDDAEFENSPEKLYTFIAHESEAAKAHHAALSKLIAQPDKYHQSSVNVRGTTFWGGEKWINAYAVLDDADASPRMLRMYKRRSAASPAFVQYAVEDCACSMVECQDCLTNWYCFTLNARKGKSQKNIDVTICTDHSKKQEAWLEALMKAGVEFEKEEAGADLANVKSIFELSAKALNSDEIVPLSRFQGKVCLVVNVASK